jgi:hypothetical protein
MVPEEKRISILKGAKMQPPQSNSSEAIFVIVLREMVIARDIEMIIGDIRPEVTVVVVRSLDEAEAHADAGRIEGIFVQAEPEAYVGSYLARRIARIASEDIGNADPRALQLALNAWDVQERLGSPEGELALGQAVVYLACAPKSNAVYKAFNAAMDDARKLGTLEVPLHLRNAPTRLMKGMGYGGGYRYAHDEAQGYAAGEKYFPEEMGEKRYYHPVARGLEIKIAEKLSHLRKLDKDSGK